VIAASIFDHPAILLLIAFVTLVRWLVSKAKAQTQNTQTPMAQPPPQPISRGGETQTEEERVRRFLEALGQPPGTTAPKVMPRRRAVPPKIFPKLPPLKTAPPPLPMEPFAPPPLPVESTTWQRASAAGLTFEVHDVARQSSAGAPDQSRRATARFASQINLGTPQNLRTAIILREIFGPPRSLQPIDLTSSS
jgi:hypothetical protein